MKKILKKYQPYIWLLSFAVFTLVSFLIGFQPGKDISINFKQFFIEMITFIPFLFIIIGLFDVWFPKAKIEKHIGQESGMKGIILVILLAMLQAGPLYGAFPVAYILHKKGASIKNIFVYLGAFSCLKIPMLGIEMGYLGWKFTLVRTLVSLPLFIGAGYFMEHHLKDKNFTIHDIKKP
jgi:uncharacterized membrane protein YraQ (UPF0718 family)